MADHHANRLHILLLGPPGAGKSTQATLLAQRCPIIAVSTGKMLRDEVAAGTALGRQVREVLAQGELVDDTLMIPIIRTWLAALPEDKGFLLDGFPRTIGQAAALDAILAELHRPLSAVVNLELTDAEAVHRLGGRRLCYGINPEEIIHVSDEAAITRCLERGGLLVQRPDDLPHVIIHRLAIYEAGTKPLLAFYQPRGIAHSISAAGAPDEVAHRLDAAIERVRQPSNGHHLVQRPAAGLAHEA